MSLRDRDLGYGPLAGLLAVFLAASVITLTFMPGLKAREDRRADAAETRIGQLETELEAARDSVLAGTVEGFALRCYFVKEEER